jgi:uncharacterized protein (TIGR02453 family)
MKLRSIFGLHKVVKRLRSKFSGMFFKSDFQQFFIELAANNNKEWFDQNKSRYLKQVKQPFERFIAALIVQLQDVIPGIDPDPKKAIFRINRDVRFSKDKTPYKLHAAAYLSALGKKDPSYSGIYLQFGPEHLMIGGGVYMPEGAQLLRIRKAIAAQPETFYKLLAQPSFKKYYVDIEGDENKRIADKELMQASADHPILLKKQFYFQSLLPPDELEQPDLMQVVVNHAKAAMPLTRFFEHALIAESK